MADEEDDRWQHLIQGLRAGNGRVIQEFCDLYSSSLHRLAEKHLPDGVKRRVGPEDVVQSVCRTFIRRANEGQFQLEDSEALWRLLCAITLSKVREQTRFHMRQKRGLNQEVHKSPPSPDDSQPSFAPAAPGPTPAEAVEFADQFHQLLASMDEEERQLVDLKLQQLTNEEAAERMGVSERTVRRILKRVQARLEKVFEVS